MRLFPVMRNWPHADLPFLSLGGWLIAGVAIVTTILVLLRPTLMRTGLEMWMFALPHRNAYEPAVMNWNATHESNVNLYVLSLPALRRRMLAGFLSDTPIADLLEVDVNAASRAFTGPVEDVGFLDLTDRLHSENIYDRINAPSYSPWTSRDRIFGLPHDVHPVMLCYRADIIEAAGIDMDLVKTWDDFTRELRPLIQDLDGDGRPDRYLLNFWHQQLDVIEALIFQAGGGYFDENDRLIIDSEINARTVSVMATWLSGPHRIAIDAEEFQAHGNKLKIEGKVLASLMPDWLCGIWKDNVPQLAGKLKLMPLPAWTLGGRRTSVWGGSMLGIAKTSARAEEAWKFAKEIYLSEPAAQRLYETNGIISPVKSLWSSDFYDVADPYFSDQSPGRMYIELAPEVPPRSSSPFNRFAKERVRDALLAVKEYAEENGIFDPDQLLPEARNQLRAAKVDMRRRIDRNVFHKENN